MGDILANVGQFITSAINWMQAFLAQIVGGTWHTYSSNGSAVEYTATASPVLIIFCIALPIVGLGIGLLKRLIKTRG